MDCRGNVHPSRGIVAALLSHYFDYFTLVRARARR